MHNGEGEDGEVGDFKGDGKGVARRTLLGNEVRKTRLAGSSGVGGLDLLGVNAAAATADGDDNEGSGAD